MLVICGLLRILQFSPVELTFSGFIIFDKWTHTVSCLKLWSLVMCSIWMFCV